MSDPSIIFPASKKKQKNCGSIEQQQIRFQCFFFGSTLMKTHKTHARYFLYDFFFLNSCVTVDVIPYVHSSLWMFELELTLFLSHIIALPRSFCIIYCSLVVSFFFAQHHLSSRRLRSNYQRRKNSREIELYNNNRKKRQFTVSLYVQVK